MSYSTHEQNVQEFAGLRLGIFIHYGLFSLLGRGEWVMNREGIPIPEYKKLADRFTAENFDAEDIVKRSKDAGAKYITFTTMHHEGFALYDSKINPFNCVQTACKRNLTTEMVEACQKHGMRVHLYHSLNNWTCTPDGVAALESASARKEFVDYTHARIRELLEMYNPIDCIWYDGWWPFHADGWRSVEMNAMVRSIQPNILINGRNGLAGDFATPEGHISAPYPYRPWEACMCHNRNWGYHAGDPHFKSPADVLLMLTQVAVGAGNLLINIGPEGSGRLPLKSLEMLEALAGWMPQHAKAIYNTQPMSFEYEKLRPGDHGDFSHSCKYTANGNTLNLVHLVWPGETFSINGVNNKILSASFMHDGSKVNFKQDGKRVTFTGLPKESPVKLASVIALECDSRPDIYLTGGLRTPNVPHPRYDPCPSDIKD